jgi:replicative DNA helicase
LRDLNLHGFDVRPFYDPTKEFLLHDEEDKKLNQLKLSEIPNRIRELLVDIENKHVGKETQTSITSEEGLRKLVSDLKETPEVGLPIDGEILNYALRGARLGKLYVYSAPSGAGKTRFLVGNACAISLPYIENGKIIKREHLKPVLFIATEMGADEIQTLIISYVSGVNEEKILLGSYSPEEEARIRLALDILDKYGKNFIIESMPDPSMAMIRAKMAKYIIQDEVEYIFYDYIFSSPGLLSEFRDLEVREDVALMMLSNTLKEVATTYQVFVQTATQLNGNWEKISTRNANLIRGSKAIADKIDIGIIGIYIICCV